MFVIDGGFSKAYQKETGIAGYTLIYNSHGMVLVSHEPLLYPRTEPLREEKDILSSTVALQYTQGQNPCEGYGYRGKSCRKVLQSWKSCFTHIRTVSLRSSNKTEIEQEKPLARENPVRAAFLLIFYFSLGKQGIFGQQPYLPDTRLPMPLQVIATAVPIYIEHLACGKKTGHQEAFHGMRVEFLCADTACRYLRGIKAHRADNGRKNSVWHARFSDIRGARGGNGFGEAKAYVAQKGAPQAVMQNPCQEIFHSLMGHCFFAALQEGNHLIMAEMTQEIQMHRQRCFSCRNDTGDFKNSRAADAEVRKLDFACIFRKDFAVSLHEDRAICTHALECLHEGGIGFYLHQRREQLGMVCP